MTRGPRWWQWPTVLSLDAPAVAVAWQGMIAKETGGHAGRAGALVLALSIWLAYSADRWIEGFRVPPDQVKTQRHRFYQTARSAVVVIWLLVLIADVSVALARLSPAQIRAGFWLMPFAMMYVLSHQFLHRESPWRLPKEICVALLLSGGVYALVAPTIPAGHSGRALLPLALFAWIAFANCVLISCWERTIDAAHGQTSIVRQFAAGFTISRLAPWIGFLLGVVVAVMFPGARAAGVCAAISGALLIVLERTETRLGWEAARVLADAVLLTPFPWLIWLACR